MPPHGGSSYHSTNRFCRGNESTALCLSQRRLTLVRQLSSDKTGYRLVLVISRYRLCMGGRACSGLLVVRLMDRSEGELLAARPL